MDSFLCKDTAATYDARKDRRLLKWTALFSRLYLWMTLRWKLPPTSKIALCFFLVDEMTWPRFFFHLSKES